MFKICKAQEKQGHKPIVLSGDYKFDENLAKDLQKTKFIVTKSYLDKFGFSIMPSLNRILEQNKENIDLIHMHVFRTFQNYVLYKFAKRNNIPYVVDAHGAVPYYKRKNFLKKLYDKLIGKKILNSAEFLIAETQVGVDEYLAIDETIDQKKIVIISPPFDTDEFEEIPEKGHFREKYNISNDKKILMFLGRVHHIKGNDFLIEGFADLCKYRDDCVLMIVGSDDGHMDECKELAIKLNIKDKVFFTGFIGGSDKNSALVDADVVLQMSRQEQGAWAPLEGVLCGTPIIVTEDTGAGEDVKRIDAGETVKFGEVKTLSKQINSILENYDAAIDKTKKAKNFIMNKMSMNARSHEYIDIYNEAINKKRLSLINTSSKNLSMLLMPDGPIAYDGKNYRSSKGERLYFDSLAKDFKKLLIATSILKAGDEGYESNLHSCIESENIEIIELPSVKTKNPSIVSKLIQFLKVFIIIF